jgi:superkiller protein 3
MTVINIKDDLAWEIALDWHDMTPNTLDLGKLMAYLELYSERISSRAMLEYLKSSISGLSNGLSLFLGKDYKAEKISLDELSSSLTNACDEEGEAVPFICVAMLIRTLVESRDWEASISWCETFTRRLDQLERQTGDVFAASRCFHSLMLATTLTSHRSPRYHEKALALLASASKSEVNDLTFLQISIAKARLLRLTGRPLDAYALLEKLSTPQAKLESAICKVDLKEFDQAIAILDNLEKSDEYDLPLETRAEAFHQKGLALRALGSSRGEYFAAFIQALRCDSRHAPTYTMLGQIYKHEIHDLRRAEKCFHEAFELSSAEVEAARELASGYAEAEEWDLVEIIVRRIVQGNERVRESWVHRAFGFVHLNCGKYADAVAAFQAAVRLASRDADAWTGLGESYLSLGRYQAAEKSFLRATECSSEDWHPKYLLAVVQLALKEYDSCCEMLAKLCSEYHRPEFDTLLCSALLGWANSLLESGWVTETIEKLSVCLKRASAALQSSRSFALADVFAEACALFAKLASQASAFGRGLLIPTELEQAVQHLESSDPLLEEITPKSDVQRSALCAIRVYHYSLSNPQLTDSHRAIIWCNIGRVFQRIHQNDATSSWFTPGIQAFKCAVKLEPNHDTFWSILGTAITKMEPKFAHHCLVKATELAPKSAHHYTNLGFFYLQESGTSQASAAFTMAQNLDASDALAWYGQGSIARLQGDADADDLFAHASTLLPQGNTAVDMAFAASVLRNEHVQHIKGSLPKAAWYARRLAQSASDPTILYNSALLEEHLQAVPSFELLEAANKVASAMEAVYESDESDLALQRYCDARALSGRLQLRLQRYEEAIETCELVSELEPSNATRSLLSCRLVMAICHAKIGNSSDARVLIDEMLTQEISEVVFILLVQSLWLSGPDAKGDVVRHLEAKSQSLAAKKMLSAVAVQTGDIKLAKQSSLLSPELACADAANMEMLHLLELALVQTAGGDQSAVLKAQLMREPWQTETWLRLRALFADDDQSLGQRVQACAEANEVLDKVRVAQYSEDKTARARAFLLKPI